MDDFVTIMIRGGIAYLCEDCGAGTDTPDFEPIDFFVTLPTGTYGKRPPMRPYRRNIYED